MQIYIPSDTGSEVNQILDGYDIIGRWRDAGDEDRLVLHVLVPADKTEPIMDKLETRCTKVDGFRVVLFPIEATLPRPDVNVEGDGPETAVAGNRPISVNDADRVSREELYSDVMETLGVSRVYIAMIVLSSIVAAFGLMRNDVAVIIGAMVIAPLLGPNVAMSLSATLGDVKLFRHALLTNITGIALAFVLSFAAGIVFTIDPTNPAIAARTRCGIGDLALALAAGSAGTFAFTRGMAGAVIGVMVAVALMPPLVTFGMLLGAGQVAPALGAFILLVTNVVCVNLAGVATFLAQGVRPRGWREEDRARRASRIAIAVWMLLLLALAASIYIMPTD